jgi:phenylacetate-CoA ligase
VGATSAGDVVLEFNTDIGIVELVDADNQPVPQGIPSAKVLVTNLYNVTQPLITFELNDVFVRDPDATDHGHLRARVRGRIDDILHYDDVDIHPVVIRSVMVKSPEVVDYQVRQTPCGVDALIVTTDASCVGWLRSQLCEAARRRRARSPRGKCAAGTASRTSSEVRKASSICPDFQG